MGRADVTTAITASIPGRPMPDTNLALDRLRALIGPNSNPEQVYYLVHEGAPVSKSRARWGRGRTYTPTETSTAQDALTWRIKEAIKGKMIEGSVAIVATFFRPNYQRIDADNLMKLVMDAATKAGAWKDDCYVVAQASYMEYDRERPRTVIAWCPATSTLDRIHSSLCVTCGDEFTTRGSWDKRKTCSPACRSSSLKTLAKCPKCNVEFMRKVIRQQYCSRACSDSAPRRRQKMALQRPWPGCEVCGERVSRREYLRCWGCRFPKL